MSRYLVFIIISISISLNLSGQCNFKAIAHRGGESYNYPENTLLSIEQAYIEGAYACEVDVRFTLDNVVILMHDSTIERTTNGKGIVSQLKYSYIKTLDAGKWKGKQFEGTRVPTLIQAMQLANKYHRKLYLNMKVTIPALLAKTVNESACPPDIVMMDPSDLKAILDYRRYMPNTPLVYFGNHPEPITDSTFYLNLKNNGVIAVEELIDYVSDGSQWLKDYRDNLHKYGLEIWIYTVNDNHYLQMIKDFGADACETDRARAAIDFFCYNSTGEFFPEKRITGQWDFNNRDLTASLGSAMHERGDTNVLTQRAKFGSTAEFKIPAINNKEVNVMLVPGYDSAHYLEFYSNINPQGFPGGIACDNEYSIIMDILKPTTPVKPYFSLLQTSYKNADDADVFINTDNKGVGIFGQYAGQILDSVWYRLALVFDLPNAKLNKYIDGVLVGTNNIPNPIDGRFCLNNNWGVQTSAFFSDNSGETGKLFVSSIQLRDYAMTADEIASLGKVAADKISQKIIIDSNLCPIVVTNPRDTAACEGSNVKFSVTSDNTFNNYLWQVNSGDGWKTIDGTQYAEKESAILKINGITPQMNNNKYRCVIKNDCSTISSTATLNVTTFEEISINYQGSDALCFGDTVVLLSIVKPEFKCQWKLDGKNITNATASSYKASSTAGYSVEVSNNNSCKRISDTLNLKFYSLPPVKITSSIGANLCKGDSVLFEANVSNIDDFESNDFSKYSWVTQGDKPWTINDTTFYKGKFSAQTGKIKDLQSTSLSVNVNNPVNDSISFFLKVSTERNFDILYFYINSCCIASWSGEIDWQKISFPLRAGNNTLKWVYAKDKSFIRGQDRCWIDNVSFPVSGLDKVITYQWKKDSKDIVGKNTKSFYAKENGKYSFAIKLGTHCMNESNQINLNFNPSPPSVITAQNNTSVCMGQSVVLNASIGYKFVYLWKKDNVIISTASSSTYNADSSGLYSVLITNNYNCSSLSKEIKVVINPLPKVNLGKDTILTDKDTITLNAGFGYINYHWNNDYQLQKYFIDGSLLADGIHNYSVTVTDNNSCSGVDSLKITLQSIKHLANILLFYDNADSTPMNNVNIIIYNFENIKIDSLYTNITGRLTINNLRNGNYFIETLIDEKCDGINPGDALLVNRYYINATNIKDDLLKNAADVNKDNDIDPGDALLINRFYINAISEFSAGRWLTDKNSFNINNSDINITIKAVCFGDVDASNKTK